MPTVLHWLAALAVASVPSAVPNDRALRWPERPPGLSGSRSGRGWSPRFMLTGWQITRDPAGGGRVNAGAVDETAGLAVRIEVEMLRSGLIRQHTAVMPTADGDHGYEVGGLVPTLPVPPVTYSMNGFHEQD